MAQTRIHLRVAVRYSATGWISPSWKAQLARSSEGKLKAARRAETRTKESVSGRRRSPSGPEASGEHRDGRAEAAVGRQEEAVLHAAGDGLRDEVEDGVLHGAAQRNPAAAAARGGGQAPRAVPRGRSRRKRGGDQDGRNGAGPETPEQRAVCGGAEMLVETDEPAAGEPVKEGVVLFHEPTRS